MWNRVDWMKPVDVAIIQFLSGSGELTLSPGNIAVNIDYDPSYVGQRCSILAEKGLIEQIEDLDGQFYKITDYGNRFNRGEVDASELVDDED